MSDRWRRMVEKYGSVAAAKAEMRRRSNLSKRNSSGQGGFAMLKNTDPELHRQLSSKGGSTKHVV